MPIVPANQSQLIRANLKDERYQTLLRNHANETFESLAGSKRWLDLRKEIELLSDLAYYGLTTCSGYQTLGEEYVNIIQVDSIKFQIPSKIKRGLFLLCHSVLPYLVGKILMCMEIELGAGNYSSIVSNSRQLTSRFCRLDLILRSLIQKAVRLLTEYQKNLCLSAVSVLQQTLTLLHQLHVNLFFITGTFYHLSKRSAGISYLQVLGRKSDNQTIQANYRILGAVSLFQSAVNVAVQFNVFRRKNRCLELEWELHGNIASSPQQAQKLSLHAVQCILCLEERRHSTATPCGHLFCWECITEWCNTKAECPLCREKLEPSRLVFLRNYC